MFLFGFAHFMFFFLSFLTFHCMGCTIVWLPKFCHKVVLQMSKEYLFKGNNSPNDKDIFVLGMNSIRGQNKTSGNYK